MVSQSVCSVEHEVPVGLGGGLDDLRPGLRLPRPLPLQQQDHRRVREEDCRASLFLDTADYFLQWKDLSAPFPILVILEHYILDAAACLKGLDRILRCKLNCIRTC